MFIFSRRNDVLQVQLRQNDLESQKMKLNNAIGLVKMLMSQYCGLNDTTFVITYDTQVLPPVVIAFPAF